MTMMKFARLMEALDGRTPTQQVSLLSKEADKFSNRPILYSILAIEYSNNNIGISRAKKWMAKSFDIFESEVESLYMALRDIGDTAYHLDTSKLNDEDIPLQSMYDLLELDCAGITSNTFTLISDSLDKMSALERKWFMRYWLKVPRNGINVGTVKKMLAKSYDKDLSRVKTHTNFNSIYQTVQYYEMNEEPSIALTHGKFVKPMLAKSIAMKKWPKEKIADFKYDGNRYQVHKKGKNVIIFNRKGNMVTYQFPDIVELVARYSVDCILDGEIYPIKSDGSPAPHKSLGTRIHSKNLSKVVEDCPVNWVAFDCLKIGDLTIMDLPYRQRLECMHADGNEYGITIPNQAHRMEDGGDVIAFYNRAINDGFEGIIVKDANAPYESGKRSAFWAKYKPPRIDLDVVVLSARYGEGARANVFASFDIGVKSDDGFMSIGSVGTGFSEKEMISITNKLRKMVEKYDGKTYHFMPKVVLEVTADLISRDAKGNIGLRFPRVVRIRDDKYISDINTVGDVIQTMTGF
jgi:DNA ligase-1